MYSSIIALILNILLNYILIFGNFGAPKLGVLGCGFASAISMWLVFIYLSSYFYLNKRYKKLMIFERASAFRGKIMREILKLQNFTHYLTAKGRCSFKYHKFFITFI